MVIMLVLALNSAESPLAVRPSLDVMKTFFLASMRVSSVCGFLPSAPSVRARHIGEPGLALVEGVQLRAS